MTTATARPDTREVDYTFAEQCVSRYVEDDDHAGQPFVWLPLAILVTTICAAIGYWGAS